MTPTDRTIRIRLHSISNGEALISLTLRDGTHCDGAHYVSADEITAMIGRLDAIRDELIMATMEARHG